MNKHANLSLSRREFLVGAGKLLGAWLVSPRLSGVISRLAQERVEPYLIEIERPQHVLWATKIYDQYIFTLDCAYTAMQEPQLTWGQWLKRKGVALSNKKEIRESLIEWGCFDPNDEEPWVMPDLNAELPGHLLQSYLDWEYTLHDCPLAKAYRYLWALELADRKAHGEGLGSLDFIEGVCPGNDTTLVTTKSVAVLGGLQQRLLQLGERVSIRVDAA
jgi:hypothetical protein